MSTSDVIRAWKNEDYRMGLSVAELSALPENPAGEVELRTNRDQNFISPHCSVAIECTTNCAV